MKRLSAILVGAFMVVSVNAAFGLEGSDPMEQYKSGIAATQSASSFIAESTNYTTADLDERVQSPINPSENSGVKSGSHAVSADFANLSDRLQNPITVQ